MTFQSLWHGVLPGSAASTTTMAECLVDVSQRSGFSIAELKGPTHRKALNAARQEAMWLMYQTRRYSRAQIGRFLGGRHPTTVLHGCVAHEARIIT